MGGQPYYFGSSPALVVPLFVKVHPKPWITNPSKLKANSAAIAELAATGEGLHHDVGIKGRGLTQGQIDPAGDG